MKVSKVISGECIQFEANRDELDLITHAMGDYIGFLEYSLKNNIINTYDQNEPPFPLTDKIKRRFERQLKTIKPIIKILHLFY